MKQTQHQTATPFSRKDAIAASITAAVALAVYISTLAPTVTAEDSGELITAAYTLGIPHPPGYPLWCMLAKLFTFIPIGSIAWRVGLLSAVLGAATAAVLCLVVIRLTRNRLAAVAAGLALALSDIFWAQCVIAEVYSLNSLLVALCMLILLVWQETRKASHLYAFAVVYGLGLCNHHTMHFLGPLFAAFILLLTPKPWRQWPTYARMLGIAFCVWLVIHLYLPIRSLANPPIDWGNPETWSNFWFHVLRRVYKYGFVDKLQSLLRTLHQFGALAYTYGHQFTIWLALLPLVGAYALWKTCRYRFLLIAGTGLYVLLGFVYVLNFDPIKRDIYINSVFFIPVFMMAAVLLGVAIDFVGRCLKKPRVSIGVNAAFCVAVPVLLIHANHYANDKSNYYFAYDYAINICKTLDRDALYFSSADHLSFPLIYLQVVEGVRPDVTHANVYGSPDEKLYEEMPANIRSMIATPPKAYDSNAIEDWIITHTDRPVYFTSERPIQSPRGAVMAAAGLLYKVVKPGEPMPTVNYWDHYEWHNLDENEIRDDTLATSIFVDYYVAKGRELFETGKREQAMEQFTKALDVAGDRSELVNNIGSICGNYGLFSVAADCYRESLKLDPDSRLARWNLAMMLNMMGQFQEARGHLEMLIAREEAAFGPRAEQLAPYLNDYAGTLFALGDVEGARGALERAQKIDVDRFGAEHMYVARDISNLSIIYHKLGKTQTADQYRTRARDIFTRLCGPDHELTRFAKEGQFIPSMCLRMTVE